jgi:hypothetical protein
MIIFTIGIFTLISIVTFSPNDPPFANYPVNNPFRITVVRLVQGYQVI